MILLSFTTSTNGQNPQSPPTEPNEKTRYEVATFAGGCFWCMQPPFDKTPGVIKTVAGYTGGRVKNPTYEQVSSQKTGHLESIEVTYDPSLIPYEKLLEVFWHNIDPTDGKGQFCDKGSSYHSAIFYHDEKQHQAAEHSKANLEARPEFKNKIETVIQPFHVFYPAEDYHQSYYKKNPIRYKYYRYRCGRDARLKEVWGDEKKH